LQLWQRLRVVNFGLEEVEDLSLVRLSNRKRWLYLMNLSDASSAKEAPKLLKFGEFFLHFLDSLAHV
jgi:hypothetical protein